MHRFFRPPRAGVRSVLRTAPVSDPGSLLLENPNILEDFRVHVQARVNGRRQIRGAETEPEVQARRRRRPVHDLRPQHTESFGKPRVGFDERGHVMPVQVGHPCVQVVQDDKQLVAQHDERRVALLRAEGPPAQEALRHALDGVPVEIGFGSRRPEGPYPPRTPTPQAPADAWRARASRP